jgi:hypothetical protein
MCVHMCVCVQWFTPHTWGMAWAVCSHGLLISYWIFSTCKQFFYRFPMTTITYHTIWWGFLTLVKRSQCPVPSINISLLFPHHHTSVLYQMLLQCWKQMIIAQCLIRAVSSVFQYLPLGPLHMLSGCGLAGSIWGTTIQVKSPCWNDCKYSRNIF